MLIGRGLHLISSLLLSLTSAYFLPPSLNAAENFFPQLEVNDRGVIRVGNTTIQNLFFNPRWINTMQDGWTIQSFRRDADAIRVAADWELFGRHAAMSETIRYVNEAEIVLEYLFRAADDAPIETNFWGVQLRLPATGGTFLLNGKEYAFPKEFSGGVILPRTKVTSLQFESGDGGELYITGDVELQIQDARAYNKDRAFYDIRVFGVPAMGALRESSLSFHLRYQMMRQKPLTAGEPEFALGGSRFRPDSEAMLSKPVAIPDDSAWAQKYLNVVISEDFRGKICWFSRENTSPIEEEFISEVEGPVRKLDCLKRNVRVVSRLCPENAAWFSIHPEKGDALAVSLGERAVKLSVPPPEPLTIQAGENWRKLDFDGDIAPGTILDFSDRLDAPAGKYGPLRIAPDGSFFFADRPGEKVRFFGVNLCFSACFPDREEAEKLAALLARAGYNAVRIHHHDTLMTNPEPGRSTRLNPETMARLDALFAALKNRGIYVCSDFFTNRLFRPEDNIPECEVFDSVQMKALAPVSSAAMANLEAFIFNWMNHVNPYTKMRYGDDPALVFMNLINEDPLTFEWFRHPSTEQLYLEKFKEHAMRDRDISAAVPGRGSPEFALFLAEVQRNAISHLRKFLRDEIKSDILIADVNMLYNPILTLHRSGLDIVDNHDYWEHPVYLVKPWSHPLGYSQKSAIAEYAATPRNVMPTRIFNKPFVMTEFNYCYPNRYRAEGGLLAGAYSALQDFQGIFRFAWSHDAKNSLPGAQVPVGFDVAHDPIGRFADLIAGELFLSGTVSPASGGVAMRVSEQDVLDGTLPETYPESFTRQGLVHRIGSIAGSGPLPADVRQFRDDGVENAAVSADAPIVSETGELVLDAREKVFLIDTPRVAAVALERGERESGVMTVQSDGNFQVVAAVSRDGAPLAASGRIVLLHLGNVLPTNLKFGSADMTRVENIGVSPLLIEKREALLTLKLDPELPSPQVYALRSNGTRIGEIPFEWDGRHLKFTLDNFCFPEGVMAYEIQRRK